MKWNFPPIFFIFLFLLSFSFSSKANTLQEQLQQAQDYYFNKKFEEAKNDYLKIMGEGHISGHLFYNLGNIAYQQNKLGEALYYYEKALRMIPRNQDLRANLDFVQSKLTHQIPVDTKLSQLFKALFFWNSYLTLKELLTLVLIIHAIFWIFLILYYLKKKFILKGVLLFSLAIFLLSGTSMGFKYFYDFKKIWGIVLKSEISVYPSFLETDKILFKLHEGNKVQINNNQTLKSQSQWIQISLSNGKKGWIHKTDLGII